MTVHTAKLPRPTAVAPADCIIALFHRLSLILNTHTTTIFALINSKSGRFVFPFDLNVIGVAFAAITLKLDHD